MSWIERRDNWLPGAKGKRPRQRRRAEDHYSVSEVADIMSVSRATVFKWLSVNNPEDAIIPPEGWIRLGDQIRIKEWALLKLQEGY